MNPQAEAELKKLVERELHVYDQFDRAGTEPFKTVVDALLYVAEKYSQREIKNFTLSVIAECLCKYLRRPEVVEKIGVVLGSMFTITSRQALRDALVEMTEWLTESGETDPDKIAYAFRNHLKYWNFFWEEDTEAIVGWGNELRPRR